LGVWLEDVRHGRRVNSGSRIPHTKEHPPVLQLDAHPDVPAYLRVLGGIFKKISEDLHQPSLVTVDINRAIRNCYVKIVLAYDNQWAHRLDRRAHCLLEIDDTPLNEDLIPLRAREIEGITDQANELHRLPLDDRARLTRDLR
jgi:hypothetical protein